MTLDEALNFALQSIRSNQLDQANQFAALVLEHSPNHPDALRILGVIARQKGAPARAIELFRRALVAKPADLDSLNLLAQTQKDLGWLSEALEVYQQILQLSPPNLADVYFRIGNIHKLQEQNDQAALAYRSAITHNPGFTQAWHNLGVALQDQSLFQEAAQAFEKAIELDPTLFLAYVNLGNSLQSIGQYAKAIEVSQKALALNPNSLLPCNNLINACVSAGLFEKALEFSEKAMSIDPHNAPLQSIVRYNLANAYNTQGLLDKAIEWYEKSLSLNPDFSQARSNLIFSMHYSIRHSAADIFREQRLWNARHAALYAAAEKPIVDPTPNRKLRVGFVSPDFRNHPVARFIIPLFAHLDPSQFTIHVYNDQYRSDSVTQSIRALAACWTEINSLSNTQFAEQVKNDQIDILIDLTSHSGFNRLPAFAMRLAPIQVSWLAYCGSTGLDAIDYRISDPLMDPPGMFDRYYSEKTALLPDCYWCDAGPASAPAPLFPQSPNPVFGSFNNFRKINDAVLALWGQILNKLPNATLLMVATPAAQNITLEKFRSMGVSLSQIRFTDHQDIPSYFSLYNQVHIALDPFPFNGGTTTCDALYMGVPVVSRIWNDRAVGRAGLSILSQVGLADLAASTDEEYVNVAVELAKNTPRLRDLRTNLRSVMQASPLMNAPRFAKNFGDLLQNLWKQHADKTL